MAAARDFTCCCHAVRFRVAVMGLDVGGRTSNARVGEVRNDLGGLDAVYWEVSDRMPLASLRAPVAHGVSSIIYT